VRKEHQESLVETTVVVGETVVVGAMAVLEDEVVTMVPFRLG